MLTRGQVRVCHCGLFEKAQFSLSVKNDKGGRGCHFQSQTLQVVNCHTTSCFGEKLISTSPLCYLCCAEEVCLHVCVLPKQQVPQESCNFLHCYSPAVVFRNNSRRSRDTKRCVCRPMNILTQSHVTLLSIYKMPGCESEKCIHQEWCQQFCSMCKAFLGPSFFIPILQNRTKKK